MKEVLLYLDEGVGPHSFQQTLLSLQGELDPKKYQIKSVDRSYFTKENWEEKTALIIFPGGRDTPYHTHLQGVANSRITNFVARGGRYLGICAGAYYGSAMIEFEKGGPLEIIASRELAFFPGVARGPAYGNNLFDYDSENGAKIAPIRQGKEVYSLYYNGGCYFASAEKYAGISVLATYDDLKKAAIVKCEVGRGFAILSGVHPEYSAEYLKQSHTHSKEVLSLLERGEKRRDHFWRSLLSSAVG